MLTRAARGVAVVDWSFSRSGLGWTSCRYGLILVKVLGLGAKCGMLSFFNVDC